MRKWKPSDPVSHSHHHRCQLSTPATALGHGPTMWTHMWRVGESRVQFKCSAGSVASQIVKCNKIRVLYGCGFCLSACHGNYLWHMDKWIFLLPRTVCSAFFSRLRQGKVINVLKSPTVTLGLKWIHGNSETIYS